jgi:hypothetical protein
LAKNSQNSAVDAKSLWITAFLWWVIIPCHRDVQAFDGGFGPEPGGLQIGGNGFPPVVSLVVTRVSGSRSPNSSSVFLGLGSSLERKTLPGQRFGQVRSQKKGVAKVWDKTVSGRVGEVRSMVRTGGSSKKVQGSGLVAYTAGGGGI